MYADQPFAYPRRISVGASLMVFVSVVVASAVVLVALLSLAGSVSV